MNWVWTRRRSLGAWRSLGVWLLFALIAWLDSDGCVFALRPGIPVQHAAVFGAIVSAISTIGGWLGAGAAASASYLATAVSWIAGRLGTFIKATGAVFAKSWDALKIVYADVLKPAVQWIDAHVKRLYGWLRTTFQPVFDFLQRVRTELLAYYERFVRPFLDVVDYVRAGLRILGTLGVDWAKALDRKLGEWESVITENFLRVLGYLNRITDIPNSIVTVNGLFQRLPLLRSLDRDAGYWIRMWWAKQIRPLPPKPPVPDYLKGYPVHEVQEDVNTLVDYTTGRGSARDALFEELGFTLLQAARTVPEEH